MALSNFLFVYGTLMSASLHPMAQQLRQHAKLMGAARWPGKLFLVNHYPGAIESDSPNDLVFGEVFELTNPVVLDELDRYEECSSEFPEPHEYKRAIKTVFVDNQAIPCWIYIYNRPIEGLALIPSGQFINFT